MIEDESEASEWALVLSSAKMKDRWAIGRPLQFAGRFYRLEGGEQDPATRRWIYRFTAWPEEEVLRGPLDYDETAGAPPATLADRLKDLLR